MGNFVFGGISGLVADAGRHKTKSLSSTAADPPRDAIFFGQKWLAKMQKHVSLQGTKEYLNPRGT